MKGTDMDTPKKKHWFKRIFLVDYGLEVVSAPLEIAPILEAEDHTVFAQADPILGNHNSSISVVVDNVNKTSSLRFGSSEAVDTVNAVWFISKTGNKIHNNFGDELSPSAPRLKVQDFLTMTQEKQGDIPFDDSVPPHDHDVYQDEIDDLDTRVEALESASSAEAYDDRELRSLIANNATNIADNTKSIADNSASIAELTASIADLNSKIQDNSQAIGSNTSKITANTLEIAYIEDYLQRVANITSLGESKWVFTPDSEAPNVGNFSGPSALLDGENNGLTSEFWINTKPGVVLGDGINGWINMSAGDYFRIQTDTANWGVYRISAFSLDRDVLNLQVDWIGGEGKLYSMSPYYTLEIEQRDKYFPDLKY